MREGKGRDAKDRVAKSYVSTILNIAHRGASACAPENTLAAFRSAVAMGADGIELDVTLTKDGAPVVIHDETVDRTTDGKGAVAQMTLAEVKRLDAGSRFGAQFRGERIPTLAEVLQAVGHMRIVNIEMKGISLKDDGLEKAVIHEVEAARAREYVILSSFNPIRLARAARLNPTIERGLLYTDRLPIYLRRAWFRPLARPSALHPVYRMVTPGYIRWAREKGYKTNTWTVNEPSEMQRLIDLRVDGIITNTPDVLKQLL